MKHLLLLTLSLTSLSAFALPLAYDGFDYPLSSPAPLYTNLVGQSADWVYAGFPNTVTNQPYIVSGSLSYPPLAPSVGNSVGFGGNSGSGTTNGMAARLNLPSAVSSGTLYYSFIVKLTDITAISTSGVFWAGFNNMSGSQATVPSIVDTRVVTRAAGTGQYQIGVDKSSGGAANFQWDPGIYNVGDVLFVVGSYTFNTGSTTDDTSQMWVNPAAADFAAASAPPPPLTATVGNDIGGAAIGSFCIFNRNPGEPHGIVLDELRVGTTWADVTPTANSIAIITQPKSVRIVEGANASFSVTPYLANIYRWQRNTVDIPGATNRTLTITNAQLSDAGTYRVIVGNGVASLTSSNATLTVKADTYGRLSPLWSIAPFSRPYVTTEPTQTPMQRYFAYNALSNQVLIVSRTNVDTLASTGMVYVLNGTNGADLYQMNADSTIISGGLNGVTLNCVDVADDGAVYGANISDANTTVAFSLYRWDNSGPSAAPVNVFTGDPYGGGNERYGDSLVVQGTNITTELLLDDSKGIYGDIMRPTDSSMTAFTGAGGQFANVLGGLTGGRTVLFADTNVYGPNTFWEHHRTGPLNLASYDLTAGTSTLIQAYTNFPSTMGVCGFNFAYNLLCGINSVDSTTSPDTLDLYDISDLQFPVYITSYNFPTTVSQGNANRCGRVIFSGDRVYALDANNGFLAFTVVPKLAITNAGANLVMSWPTNFPGYTLTASPSLAPAISFTNVSTGTIVGSRYEVTATPSAAKLFYRLKK